VPATPPPEERFREWGTSGEQIWGEIKIIISGDLLSLRVEIK